MKTNRNHLVDSLKGLSAILVVVSHFEWTLPLQKMLLFPFWMNMTVPVFMIVLGYGNTISYEKHNTTTALSLYNPLNWLPRLLRYVIPFTVTFAVEMVYYYYLKWLHFDKASYDFMFETYITGGVGKGSYFFPLLTQIIFLCPVIYLIVKKLRFAGLIICGAVNLIYEAVKYYLSVGDELYRLLSFRYILLLAAGCYVALYGFELTKKTAIISTVSVFTGFMFIVLTFYFNVSPFWFNQWTGSCCVSALYIIPPILYLIAKKGHLQSKFLSFVGKASYNIFLFQMVWIAFGAHTLNRFTSSNLVFILANTIICVIGGILFYLIDNPVTGFIKSLFRRKNKSDVERRT